MILIIISSIIVFLSSVASGGWIIGTSTPQFLSRGGFGIGDCWYDNFLCKTSSPLDTVTGVNTSGLCMSRCAVNTDCKFFTWRPLWRGVVICILMSDCEEKDYRHPCLNMGTSVCVSGPADCGQTEGQVKNCTKLSEPEEGRMKWQCEDGRGGNLVYPYEEEIIEGSRCLLTGEKWESQRWTNFTIDSVAVQKGFLYSYCYSNGTWSQPLPNDFEDGVEELEYPKPEDLNLDSYIGLAPGNSENYSSPKQSLSMVAENDEAEQKYHISEDNNYDIYMDLVPSIFENYSPPNPYIANDGHSKSEEHNLDRLINLVHTDKETYPHSMAKYVSTPPIGTNNLMRFWLDRGCCEVHTGPSSCRIRCRTNPDTTVLPVNPLN